MFAWLKSLLSGKERPRRIAPRSKRETPPRVDAPIEEEAALVPEGSEDAALSAAAPTEEPEVIVEGTAADVPVERIYDPPPQTPSTPAAGGSASPPKSTADSTDEQGCFLVTCTMIAKLACVALWACAGYAALQQLNSDRSPLASWSEIVAAIVAGAFLGLAACAAERLDDIARHIQKRGSAP
jgi:hypothetical protein